MGFLHEISRAATSIASRYRLWVWGDQLRVGGKLIYRDPSVMTPNLIKTIARGRYEKAERDLLEYMRERGFIARGDRVIEAGGGLGTLSMQIADIVGKDAVQVFEPNPRTAEALRKNLLLNGYNIHVAVAALIAEARTETAFLDSIGYDDFTISGTHRGRDRARLLTVPAISIADAIVQFDPTVLVLDVEGAEFELLTCVSDWMRVRSIHLEIHPSSLSDNQVHAISSTLEQHRFQRMPIPTFDSYLALFVR